MNNLLTYIQEKLQISKCTKADTFEIKQSFDEIYFMIKDILDITKENFISFQKIFDVESNKNILCKIRNKQCRFIGLTAFEYSNKRYIGVTAADKDQDLQSKTADDLSVFDCFEQEELEQIINYLNEQNVEL